MVLGNMVCFQADISVHFRGSTEEFQVIPNSMIVWFSPVTFTCSFRNRMRKKEELRNQLRGGPDH